MRHLVIVGLFATILTGLGVHRLTRRTQPEPVQVDVSRLPKDAESLFKSLWTPVSEAKPESILLGRREEAVVEPILVLPDAPLPEPPLIASTEELPVSTRGSVVAVRPEPGRRWMPYAEEDGKLAEERRADWDRIVARTESGRANFDETSEPPLANPEKKSR